MPITIHIPIDVSVTGMVTKADRDTLRRAVAADDALAEANARLWKLRLAGVESGPEIDTERARVAKCEAELAPMLPAVARIMLSLDAVREVSDCAEEWTEPEYDDVPPFDWLDGED